MADDMAYPAVNLRLPEWIDALVREHGAAAESLDQRVAFAIELARRNVEEGTGGPFAAAVFEIATGRLIAPGVNIVVPSRCSSAHAEVVALAVAQQAVGAHQLGQGAACELVTSCEPCTMCMGATLWSGVSRLVCAARDEDATGVGFDEGPKPADWVEQLARRGIEVVRDVQREKAADVLRSYRDGGGEIYNPRSKGS
jgi:tRNA(Arg) A34 adenosine deaminase TadA